MISLRYTYRWSALRLKDCLCFIRGAALKQRALLHCGMKEMGRARRGHLFASLRVAWPMTMDEASKELLREVLWAIN